MSSTNPARSEPTSHLVHSQTHIRELAEKRLRNSAYLALQNVRCDCSGGVLRLRGSLSSYYLKQLAQVAVAHLEGVERIDNEIQVVAPTILQDDPASSL